MREEKEIAPDLLDLRSVTPQQRGGKRAGEQFDDGGAAGADRVTVADPDRAVGIGDADKGRLLTHEGLDRVDALHLGLEIDHADLDTCDGRHPAPPLVLFYSTKYLSCDPISVSMIAGARSS